MFRTSLQAVTLIVSLVLLNIHLKWPDTKEVIVGKDTVSFEEVRESNIKASNVKLEVLRERLKYKVSELALIAETVDQLGLISKKQLAGIQSYDQNAAIGGLEIDCQEGNCVKNENDVLESAPKHNTLAYYEKYSDLELLQMADKYINLIFQLPLTSPLPDSRLTSGYGYRKSPFTGKVGLHRGMDLAKRYGSKIVAPAPGVVTKSHYHGQYGRLIEIKHSAKVSTRYAHLSKQMVKVGQKINKDQLIGLVGSTGRSTGSHLHYEVIVDGEQVNPKELLALGNLINELY